MKAGAFDWDVAEKFQRFVDMCDTFHLPIVNLVDQPGFLIGERSERFGTIRKGVRASSSVLQATIPWATIYVRRCFGVAGGSQSDPARLNWRYAWPSAYWGNIPVEGGVYAAHRTEIESADDPEARHKALQEYYRAFASPFRAADALRHRGYHRSPGHQAVAVPMGEKGLSGGRDAPGDKIAGNALLTRAHAEAGHII